MGLNTILRLGKSLVAPPTYAECAARALPNHQAEVRGQFQRPFILGASISANLRTPGPADRVLRRLGLAETSVDRLAENGATARLLLPQVAPSRVAQASVVMAIDLFFWDATLPSLRRSLLALDRLVELTATHRTPTVLATIPDVTWRPLQWARPELNRAIRKACEQNPHLHLLDLSRLNRKIEAEGGFWLGQDFYPMNDIAPDGIHLGAPACEYLAEHILALF